VFTLFLAWYLIGFSLVPEAQALRIGVFGGLRGATQRLRMSPKAKRSAVAAGKKSTKAAPGSPTTAIVTCQLNVECKKAKRCLERSPSDVAVDAYIERKLANTVDKATLEGRRNSKGESIKVVLKEEYYRSKQRGGRLSTKFWVTLFHDFKLSLSHLDLLEPIVKGGDALDSQLMDHLEKVQCENPAGRKPMPVIHYLPRMGAMNYSELYLCLHSMSEGPKVTFANAVKLHMALLDHFARIIGPFAALHAKWVRTGKKLITCLGFSKMPRMGILCYFVCF
jgi:hypothetical protein